MDCFSFTGYFYKAAIAIKISNLLIVSVALFYPILEKDNFIEYFVVFFK